MEKPDDKREEKSRCKKKDCWDYKHYDSSGYCHKHSNEQSRRRAYKLSEPEFDLLMEIKCCEICGNEFNLKNTSNIDHCHKTNKVRGMLCRRCNTSIGKFEDNVEILQNAIDYIKKHRLSFQEYLETL